MLMGNALWTLVKQSDSISKLVLLVLLGMSILCWAIFLYKLIIFRIKKRQLNDALAQVKDINTLEQMLEVANKQSGTTPGYFLSKNLAFLKSILETSSQQGTARLTEHEWRLMQQKIYNTVDDMARFEEQHLPVLSTSAAISTLLGLFGTVWGLVHSFVGISEKQTADIATVAPGIAEALITTLAGLMIAIPAIVMFNIANVQVARIEQQLMTLADRFSFVIQRLLVR